MWVKQCHKPPKSGNGTHTTYKDGDDWGIVYDCFTHIKPQFSVSWSCSKPPQTQASSIDNIAIRAFIEAKAACGNSAGEGGQEK